MFATYEEAFAHYAPMYRAHWSRSRKADREAAVRDILATLKLHVQRSPYAAKLYAELDAIRDAELAYQKRRG